MRIPVDIRLLPLFAIVLALLAAINPLLGIEVGLAAFVLWLVIEIHFVPPRTAAEVRFWPRGPSRAPRPHSRFFERDPRPDTND